jgi:exodeoxyribonuclease VII large subunit
MARLQHSESDSSGAPRFYTVSEITAEVKSLIEDSFPPLWVVGEVSNLSCPRSGHVYLTLKDPNAQLGAVIWRGVASRIRFQLKNGLEVLAYGRLDVYPPHGKYQLIIDRIQPKGIGELQLAFQQLKEKLQKEGLFDPAHKKPLPGFPRRVGIVTSPTGAAVRDIITIMGRRCPAAEAILNPVRVQGEGAAEEIAAAIRRMNEIGDFDVLIVGRGGGSIEDLWAFNEEIVARAIYASRIPVISAVGHEADFTISDLVADVRAPTPTAAAEMVAPDCQELLLRLNRIAGTLRATLAARLTEASLRLKRCADSHALRRPVDLIRQKQQRLDELSQRVSLLMSNRLLHGRERWTRMAEVLESLSPLNVLRRGYTVTVRERDRAVVRKVSQVASGERIRTILAAGEVVSVVERAGKGGR